jgi:hypothetical protein
MELMQYLAPSPRWERIVPLIFPFPNIIRVRVWEREKGEGNKMYSLSRDPYESLPST